MLSFIVEKEKPHSFYCQQPVFCGPPCNPPQQPAGESKQGGEEHTEEGTATSEQVPSSGDPPPQQGERGSHHAGVVCDGCSSGIYGTRYKCLMCPDYDLCSSCEKKGTHVNHNMLSIKEPLSYNPWGFHRGPWRGRGGHPHCRGRRGHPHPGAPWMAPYFLQHLAGQWGQGSGYPECCPQQQLPQEKPAQRKVEEMETEQSVPGSAPSDEESAQLEREQRQSYLQDIGGAVSTFLRPFGVKVDVGVVDEGPPKGGESDDKPKPSAPSKVPSGYEGDTVSLLSNRQCDVYF